MSARFPTRLLSGKFIRLCLWSIAGAVVAYLLVRHQEHLRTWLPLVVLLACPLMHLLMHRNHDHRAHEPGSMKATNRE